LADILDKVKEKLGELALEVREVGRKEAFILVPQDKVTEAARILFKDMKARFATATGIDTRDAIEVNYHFCFDEDSFVVSIKARAAKPEVELDSVTPIIPAAGWIEREMYDLLGVKFRNHPDMRRLILSDDWPEGVHPLRKDYRK
jgi:Ni,Fe-hydrogenase III component G